MLSKLSVPVNTTFGLSPSVVPLAPTRQSSTVTNKYALLVGIEYLDTPSELLGCRQDTLRFQQLLTTKLGFQRHQTNLLLEKSATYQGICNGLSRCVSVCRQAPTELVIYFSGHGIGFVQKNTTESDGQDEALVPYDFDQYGLVTDDTIWSYLRRLPSNCHCLCVWDSCNSGTVADLGYLLSGGGLRNDSGGRVCPELLRA